MTDAMGKSEHLKYLAYNTGGENNDGGNGTSLNFGPTPGRKGYHGRGNLTKSVNSGGFKEGDVDVFGNSRMRSQNIVESGLVKG